MVYLPAGTVVTEAEPHSDEWFAARRDGITGTDLPKILGLSNYGNALSVWRDKRNEATDEAGEAAYWGTKQEPIVADRWAELNTTNVHTVGVVANRKQPWIRASLDRTVSVCPDAMVGTSGCGLEIKTRNAFVAGKWREEVPDDVLAQVQWGLIATGFKHMHVAVLIGGQKLCTYRIGRDPKLEHYLEEAAGPVWQSVIDGIPPEVHPDRDGVLLRELNDMFRKREGEKRLPTASVNLWIHEYDQGHALETRGKAIKTVAKTSLVKLLGGAETAVGDDDEVLYTYKRPDESEEVTAKQLARLKAENPELFANMVALGYITKTNPNPRINIKRSTTNE